MKTAPFFVALPHEFPSSVCSNFTRAFQINVRLFQIPFTLKTLTENSQQSTKPIEAIVSGKDNYILLSGVYFWGRKYVKSAAVLVASSRARVSPPREIQLFTQTFTPLSTLDIA